jgi:nucleotide-binding universal stress UspA family protein
MIQRIVVGVNETPAAVHALREAALIADAAGAELIALTIVENPWSRVTPTDVEGYRRFRGNTPADMAEQHAIQALEQLVAEAIGPGRAQCAVRFGLPGIELARWAELMQADLLVLGRQPTGEMGRRPAGRTISGTLARSRVHCLVVPFGQRTWRRVVAAISHGPAADAVEWAATEFAALWDAVPVCVHAEPSSGPGTRRTAASEHGGTVTATAGPMVHGDPAGEVLKVVREHQADALVIGYHRGETAAEMGRVAPQLLERAPCAVLAVPV